jgi:dTDP-4-amino-4,6-dideoxygalactose transaminase
LSIYHAPLAAYLAQRESLDQALMRTLASGSYVLGEEVKAFEREFAAVLGGSGEAVGVANGTDALLLALRALGIGPGDQVITVAHTAGATASAILQCGAIPLLVDIDPQRYTIDPEHVLFAIRALQKPNALRAIVAVHLYGQAAPMTALREIANTHGLLLIEDCAQAFGAHYQGQALGTLGDASAFSFYPTKNLAAFGDGGLVYLDRKGAKRVRSLRQFGWSEPQLSLEPGMNSRLDELQAAILRLRLPMMPALLAQRLRIAQRYHAALQDTALGLPSIGVMQNAHALHQYVIRSRVRDRLLAALNAHGVPARVHYPYPVHQQPGYAKSVQIGAGGLAHSEQAAREILSLPIHPYLPDAAVEQVIQILRAAVA